MKQGNNLEGIAQKGLTGKKAFEFKIIFGRPNDFDIVVRPLACRGFAAYSLCKRRNLASVALIRHKVGHARDCAGATESFKSLLR